MSNNVILELLCRSTIWLIVAAVFTALALRFLRVHSPRVQAACWFMVLMQGVVVWGVPISLPSWRTSSDSAHSSTGSSGDTSSSTRGVDAAARDAVFADRRETQVDSGDSLSWSHVHHSTSSHPTKVGKSVSMSWQSPAVAVWGIGAGAILLLSVVRYVFFLRNLSNGSIQTDQVKHVQRCREWQAILRETGFSRRVRLLTTNAAAEGTIDSPFQNTAFCGWSPRGYFVVVPATLWRDFSAAERRSVFVHEITHLQQGDLWTALAARLAIVVHWFNPIAWWVGGRFQSAIEAACDRRVVQRVSAVDYVRALIRLGSGPVEVSLVKSARQGRLAQRIRHILNTTTAATTSSSRWRSRIVIATAIGLLVLAGVRPRWGVTGSAPQPARLSVAPSDEAPRRLPDRAVRRLGVRRFNHRYHVDRVVFAPDGSWMAAVGNSIRPRVDIWSPRDGSLIRSLIVPDEKWSWGKSVAVSPDGRRLLLGDSKGFITLFDVSSGSILYRGKRHGRSVQAVAFGPASKRFATGAEDGKVFVCKTDDPARPLQSWTTDENAITKFEGASAYSNGHGVASVVFGKDGKTLFAGTGGPASVFVLDLETGKTRQTIRQTHGGEGPTSFGPSLQSIHVLPDGDRILTAGVRTIRRSQLPPGKRATSLNVNIAEVKVWDWKSGKLLRDVTADRFDIGFGMVGLSQDGNTLAMAGFDELVVMDLNMLQLRNVISAPGWWGRTPAFSPNGRMVAAPMANTVQLWDLSSGQPRLDDRRRHRSIVRDVAWRGRLAATCGAAEVNLWDSNTGALLRQFSLGGGGYVKACAFNEDGSRIAFSGKAEDRTGRPFGMVQMWATEGDMSWTARTSSDVRHLALSSNGKRVAGARTNGSLGDTRVELWEVEDRVLKRKAEYPPANAKGLWDCEELAFSKDGRFLWIAQSNGQIVRWDTASEANETDDSNDWHFVADWRDQELKEKKKRPWLGAAAFALQAGRVITSTTNRLYVWDLKTGELIKEFTLDDIRKGIRMAVTDDGRLLAASEIIYAGEPGSDTIRIFDLETGRQLSEVTPEDDRAFGLAWSDDQNQLLSGFTSGTAMIWNVSR